jgi:ribose transport system ATP-binding protein
MLELRNIGKSFPGVRALDDVSLSFNPGEIHALLGENGAGKSTLIKVISGMYQEYDGEFSVDGKVLRLKSYQDALEEKISVVNQEIQVIPEASVAENIVMDKLHKFRSAGRVDWKLINNFAVKYLRMVELDLDPKTPIGFLSAAQKQLIQIAKALSCDSKILILDEPTSAITKHESTTLFSIMRKLKNQGVTLIFVSHKLEEIFEVCDRVTVIRDGKWIGTDMVGNLTHDDIVEMMIGRVCLNTFLGNLDFETAPVALEAVNLSREGAVDDISFKLRKGEILGFYGMIGAGRTELAKVLIGEDSRDSGEILVNGKSVHYTSTSEAIDNHRIGYVSENRKEEGLILDFDVEQNIGITIWKRLVAKFSRKIDDKAIRVIENQLVDHLSIRITGLSQRVGDLSGGNQQKVSISKWLAADCDILIIDEPTIGVDVGAKEYIHNLIWNLAKEEHKAIILISSDLPEMIKLSRRILVFREHKVVGELDDLNGRESLEEEKLSKRIGATSYAPNVD